MRISELNRGIVITALAAALSVGPTFGVDAFDRKNAETRKESPWLMMSSETPTATGMISMATRSNNANMKAPWPAMKKE